MKYHIIEKNNPFALHAIFDSLDRAQNHLNHVIPEYVRRGYYINLDSKITADSFKIKEVQK